MKPDPQHNIVGSENNSKKPSLQYKPQVADKIMIPVDTCDSELLNMTLKKKSGMPFTKGEHNNDTWSV